MLARPSPAPAMEAAAYTMPKAIPTICAAAGRSFCGGLRRDGYTIGELKIFVPNGGSTRCGACMSVLTSLTSGLAEVGLSVRDRRRQVS